MVGRSVTTSLRGWGKSLAPLTQRQMGQGSRDPAGGSGQASQDLNGARWRAYPILSGGLVQALSPGEGGKVRGRE